ncbi:MAG TPA: beta-propeller fold lactonase family protein, partial [Pyrinomonadaceae bacterium]
MTNDPFSRRQFLKAGGIGMFGALASRTKAWTTQAKNSLYVGTYTSSGKSDGIYLYWMDPLTGALHKLKSFKSVNPSFLTVDRSRRYLYVVNEVGDYLGKPGGGVSAFAIDQTDLSLRLLNQQAT